MVVDIVVTVLSWTSVASPKVPNAYIPRTASLKHKYIFVMAYHNLINQILSQDNPRDEVLANRLLEFLMKHSFHSKRAVFRHNLEIIRTLVECWKDCLHVPYR